MGLFFRHAIAVERAALLVRLVIDAQCSEKDKDIAIAWIGETLEEMKGERAPSNGTDSGGIL